MTAFPKTIKITHIWIRKQVVSINIMYQARRRRDNRWRPSQVNPGPGDGGTTADDPARSTQVTGDRPPPEARLTNHGRRDETGVEIETRRRTDILTRSPQQLRDQPVLLWRTPNLHVDLEKIHHLDQPTVTDLDFNSVSVLQPINLNVNKTQETISSPLIL